MAFTPTLILPLPSTPNIIFTNLWDEPNDNSTQASDTVAFGEAIHERDQQTCIVCERTDIRILDCTHIIPFSEPDTWEFMRGLNYIPPYAKSVAHEARNGIVMCRSHHSAFDSGFRFYIRWISETNQFIIINHSQHPDYEPFHGKVLHFSTDTRRCPFPTAFLWHECRVRGFHPTRGDRTIPTCSLGLLRGGVSDSEEINKDTATTSGYDGGEPNDGHDDTNTAVSFTPIPLVGDKLVTWLEAARQHSSWKDCAVENLSWDGTTAENIEKYRHEVGLREG